MYAEVCSCRPPCPCELTDVSMGCKGVAAYEIKKGTYDGKDISGTKFAYALSLAEKDGWVHIYVDQKDAKKHDASVAFANGRDAAPSATVSICQGRGPSRSRRRTTSTRRALMTAR